VFNCEFATVSRIFPILVSLLTIVSLVRVPVLRDVVIFNQGIKYAIEGKAEVGFLVSWDEIQNVNKLLPSHIAR
jgi:hypothetical protein